MKKFLAVELRKLGVIRHPFGYYIPARHRDLTEFIRGGVKFTLREFYFPRDTTDVRRFDNSRFRHVHPPLRQV